MPAHQKLFLGLALILSNIALLDYLKNASVGTLPGWILIAIFFDGVTTAAIGLILIHDWYCAITGRGPRSENTNT